ncbi:rhomboid-like protein 20 isoform X2 [Canna indica]|uniref:Rhomboid-like protein 20 isoform X2 n=1 Tax=Canna indica TaxID=4628 RepID=A0AAQ3PZN4_9LILI|nr:rhomboid-like protein 20 isoform X2 [Canna indica]
MLHGGPPGFHNAPVTRTLVISSAIITVTSGLRGRVNRLGLSYQDITENHNLWKTVPSVFAFSSTPELIIGLYLIYYFRIFERQIGSNKYSVFVLFSSIVSTLFEIAALRLLKDSRVLASGPYGLIFASFIPFFLDIPVTSRFRMLGLKFSDKSAVYFAGFQLLLYSWKRSFIPGICGLVAGFLFRINAFGIRRLKFPKKIASAVSRLFLSSSTSSSRSSSANVRGNARVSYIDHHVQRNYPSAGLIPMPEPPESSIATLVSMGFDSNAARQALMQARNDVNVATNILLEAQTR